MNLKDFRISSGLKTAKIAQELGISTVQLYNIEMGKVKKVDKLKKEKLASIYFTTVKEIEKAIAGGAKNDKRRSRVL